MRKLAIAVGLAFMFLAAQKAQAQLHAGSSEFTLSGAGASDNHFDGTALNANVGFGYMLTNEFELGIRQGVSYAHGAGDDLTGETRLAADWNFDLGKLQPFVGATAGVKYGDGLSYIAGPEIGLRYWIKPDVALYLSAAYDFSGNDLTGLRGNASKGEFVYTAGISLAW